MCLIGKTQLLCMQCRGIGPHLMARGKKKKKKKKITTKPCCPTHSVNLVIFGASRTSTREPQVCSLGISMCISGRNLGGDKEQNSPVWKDGKMSFMMLPTYYQRCLEN